MGIMGRPKNQVVLACKMCGASFSIRVSHARPYCSRTCSDAATKDRYRARRAEKACEACGRLYLVPPHRAEETRFCSRACANPVIARESSPAKGAAQRGKGRGVSYIKLGGRHMHRVVAEQKIGRALLPGEVVHHKNGDHRDNREENLEVLPDQAAHAQIHATKGRKCLVPGCGRKHVAKGFCHMHWRRDRKAK